MVLWLCLVGQHKQLPLLVDTVTTPLCGQKACLLMYGHSKLLPMSSDYINNTFQKFGFLMFLSIMLTNAIHLIKNTVIITIFFFFILLIYFKILFILVMTKIHFQPCSLQGLVILNF